MQLKDLINIQKWFNMEQHRKTTTWTDSLCHWCSKCVGTTFMQSVNCEALVLCQTNPVDFAVVLIIAIYISSQCSYSEFTGKLDKFMWDIDITSKIVKRGDFNMKFLTVTKRLWWKGREGYQRKIQFKTDSKRFHNKLQSQLGCVLYKYKS